MIPQNSKKHARKGMTRYQVDVGGLQLLQTGFDRDV